MKFVFSDSKTRGCLRILLLLSACLTATGVRGQSTDIAMPLPVRTTEVTGTISARDIGDARLTDHYYAFTGTPGDVTITVDSRNLDGDIDVFTSTGLRPLLKFTVYSSNVTSITKSIYLRKREDLILRIEARTPNDDAGTYRLSFGGSFEPFTGGPSAAETQSAPLEDAMSSSAPKKGRRVSSVGARIEEPPSTEVAAAPTPEPTPSETPAAPAETAEAKPTESVETPKASTPRTSARNPRSRRGSTRRTRTPPPPKAEEPATAAEPVAKTPETEPKPTAPPSRRSTRRGGSAARQPAQEEVKPEIVETGPRLVIETNDGTMINRYMSSVRRVTVENGQVVVVGKDGKTERIPLVNVLRMLISP
ncbi:MAG TPA: hypothetical protein VJU86_22080 [Pyrinomonadaceae bacterium]|nr:hypothetical protein [Pyrinomonadaceae bacterium]